jgi:hypothetical protein
MWDAPEKYCQSGCVGFHFVQPNLLTYKLKSIARVVVLGFTLFNPTYSLLTYKLKSREHPIFVNRHLQKLL